MVQRYKDIKSYYDSIGTLPDYMTLTDKEWADLSSTLRSWVDTITTRNQDGPVPVSEVLAALLRIGKWADLQGSILNAAINFRKRLDTNDSSVSDVDFTASDVLRDVNALVAGGVLTQIEADRLIALGNNRQSLADIAGIGGLRPRDLGRMRIEARKGLI